jgi:hypothetical protein
MAVYLFCLSTSAFMNWYKKRVALVEDKARKQPSRTGLDEIKPPITSVIIG